PACAGRVRGWLLTGALWVGLACTRAARICPLLVIPEGAELPGSAVQQHWEGNPPADRVQHQTDDPADELAAPDRLDAGDEADDRQEEEDPVEDQRDGDGDDPEQHGPAGRSGELSDESGRAAHRQRAWGDRRRHAAWIADG